MSSTERERRWDKLVDDAISWADEGWQYAGDYFREKHSIERALVEMRAEHRALVADAERPAPVSPEPGEGGPFSKLADEIDKLADGVHSPLDPDDWQDLASELTDLANRVRATPVPGGGDGLVELLTGVAHHLRNLPGMSEADDIRWAERLEAAARADLLADLLTSDEARAEVVDFLDAWRFCPVSRSDNSPTTCLEDAAGQLLAAVASRLSSREGGGES